MKSALGGFVLWPAIFVLAVIFLVMAAISSLLGWIADGTLAVAEWSRRSIRQLLALLRTP
jgi:putative Mn2+ efflux pump MntP